VTGRSDPDLELRVGDLVEVRSEDEILRTLDSRGTLDSLPFMPEMLEFCGKRFRVYKSAHKACDTIDWGTQRRIENAVHLEGLRCDGGAHGGCGAGCLIYWKEAWLKRVADSPDATRASDPNDVAPEAGSESSCTREALVASTSMQDETGETVYSCQATELVRASVATIPWWALWQYVRDVRSGNAGVGAVFRGLAVGLFNKFQRANRRISPRLTLIRGGRTYPFVEGQLTGSTPASGDLMLEPGELVEVKSKDAIFATLNERDSTRGLRFDGEMLQYCGRRGRVERRVERIIDEKTGRMLPIKSDSILIEGFVCPGTYHRSCPRASPLWWREIWLERVDEPVTGDPPQPEVTAQKR